MDLLRGAATRLRAAEGTAGLRLQVAPLLPAAATADLRQVAEAADSVGHRATAAVVAADPASVRQEASLPPAVR